MSGVRRPSVGEPGYLPYCGGCSTMKRMNRDEARAAFVCRSCGLETRRINGEDMFDRTAPAEDNAVSDDHRPRVVENVGAAYRALRNAKILDLLGQWVSGLDPILRERVDVSPQILAQFGLTHDEAVPPTIVNEIHWLELTE